MKGLYNKYIIIKANGKKVDPDARYFVLRIDTDPHARIALRAYGKSVKKENPKLAAEIEAYLYG